MASFKEILTTTTHILGALLSGVGRVFKAVFANKFMRILGSVLKWSLLVFLVVFTAGYLYFSRASYVEQMIKDQVAANTHGSIDLKVERSSLFYGFKARDLVLKAGKEKNFSTLMKIGLLDFDFNLPGHLIGDLGVKNIHLKDVEIFVEKQGDTVNWDTFARDSFYSIVEAAADKKDGGEIKKYKHYEQLAKAEAIVREAKDRASLIHLFRALGAFTGKKPPPAVNPEKIRVELARAYFIYRQVLRDLEAREETQKLTEFEARVLREKLPTNADQILAFLRAGQTLPFMAEEVYLPATNPYLYSSQSPQQKLIQAWNQIEEGVRNPGELEPMAGLVAAQLTALKKFHQAWEAGEDSDDKTKKIRLPVGTEYEDGKTEELSEAWENLKTEFKVPPPANMNAYTFPVLDYVELPQAKGKKQKISLVNPTRLQENLSFCLDALRGELEAIREGQKPAAPPEWSGGLFSFQLLFQVQLENLKIHVLDKEQEQGIQAGLENFSFRTILLTKRISMLPGAKDEDHRVDWVAAVPELLDMLDTVLFELNPKENFRFFVKANNQYYDIDPKDFNLNFRTYIDGAQEKKFVQLKADIGQNKMPVTVQGKDLQDPGFRLKYDIQYDPHTDRLDIFGLNLTVLEDTWLNMKGYIANAQDDSKRKIDIRIDQSKINITKAVKRAGILIGGLPTLQGVASIAPFKIAGTMKDMTISGGLSLNQFYFYDKGTYISIPSFNLPYEMRVFPEVFTKPKKTARLDAEELIRRHKSKPGRAQRWAALFAGPAQQDTKNEAPENAENDGPPENTENLTGMDAQLAGVHHVKIGPSTGSVNGAPLKIFVELNKEKNLSVDVGLNGFNFSQFANSPGFKASGNVYFDLNIKGKTVYNPRTKVSVYIPNFRYNLNNAKSGKNKFTFKTDISTSLSKKMAPTNVQLNDISMNLNNSLGKPGMEMKVDGGLSGNLAGGANGPLNAQINLKHIKLHVKDLAQDLDAANRETLKGLAEKIEKPVVVSGQTNAKINGGAFKIKHDTYVAAKYWTIDASQDNTRLHLRADVDASPGFKNIDVNELSFDGLNGALALMVKGKVPTKTRKVKGKMVTGPVPDLDIDFKFGFDERKAFVPDQYIRGWVKFNGKFDTPFFNGKLVIDDFNYDDGKFTEVKNINMDFPINYNLELEKTVNLTSGNKEVHMMHAAFVKKPNFTIEGVSIAHPTVKTKDNKPTVWKVMELKNNAPGLMARMDIEDNVFNLSQMKIRVLNGLVVGQDIMLNIGTGNPKEMEYKARIQVKDIDLKPLIRPDKRKDIEKGTMKIDIAVVGNRLDKPPIENMKTQVSVYEIGKQFAIMGMRVVQPESNWLIDALINGTITVKSFDLDLSKGMVDSEIKYDKGFVKYAVNLSGNAIKQERIVLSDFINRVQSEVKVYSTKEKGAGEAKTAAAPSAGNDGGEG